MYADVMRTRNGGEISRTHQYLIAFGLEMRARRVVIRSSATNCALMRNLHHSHHRHYTFRPIDDNCIDINKESSCEKQAHTGWHF